MAPVSVVLPWSMWPIVPTLTCGFVRVNTSLAICVSFSLHWIKWVWLEEKKSC